MEPLISIIVPVYNVEKYLSRCLESIIGQTYKNLEIILVNDGSSDKSGEICSIYAKIDKRIKVIHKENGGVSSARNAGLIQCKGEFITFIDADDWVDIQYCDLLVQIAKKCDAEMVCCSLIGTNGKSMFAIDQQSVNTNELKEVKLNDSSFEFYQWYSINGPCCKLIRRNLIFQTQMLLFDELLCVGEDLVFYIELLTRAKKCMAIAKPMYHYLIREGSAMQIKDFCHEYSKVQAWDKTCKLLNPQWNAYCLASEKLLFYTYYFVKYLREEEIYLKNEKLELVKDILFSKQKYNYILGTGWKFRVQYLLLKVRYWIYFRWSRMTKYKYKEEEK